MPKRILQGVVVSDKQAKTVVVKVERRFTHPLLKKTVRRSKNYHAHDENKQFKVGDAVSIEETKRISIPSGVVQRVTSGNRSERKARSHDTDADQP